MKKIIILLFTVSGMIIAAGSSSSSNDDKLKEYYSQGMNYIKSEKYQKAIKSFEKVLKIDSKDAAALNQLAFSLRKTGKIDQAIIMYHKALKIKPNFPQAREYLGEAYLQAALKELQQLKKYGSRANNEYQDLKKAIKEIPKKIN